MKPWLVNNNLGLHQGMLEVQFQFCWYQTFDFFILVYVRCPFFSWFMSKFMHYIGRCCFGPIIHIRTKIRPVSSLHGSWFCLARKCLLIHQKISDCLVFELQLLGEIKLYVVLCKAYIPGTWLSK